MKTGDHTREHTEHTADKLTTPRSTSRRRYFEEEKAQALAFLDACKGGYKQAAKETGIPWTTLRDWHQGRGIPEGVAGENGVGTAAEGRARWRTARIVRLEAPLSRILAAMEDEHRIANASMPQLVAAFRVVSDKLLALHQAQQR